MKKQTTLIEKRGSALVTVLILATVLAFVVAAILRHAVNTQRITHRHELRLSAKSAAESMAEYGFAQIRHLADTQLNIAADALAPGKPNALQLPSETLLSSDIDRTQSEIRGGYIPESGTPLSILDPTLLINEGDPLAGKRVSSRKIAVYTKASVKDPKDKIFGNLPNIESYVSQVVDLRESPLFAHAVFYNMDLEISPGPVFKIYGPVHTNGNLYVMGSSGLYFEDRVTVAKDLIYDWGTTRVAAQGSGSEPKQGANVYFLDQSGRPKKMTDGGLLDSTKSGWAEKSIARWNGNILTREHDVKNYRPVAFDSYKPDDLNTPEYDPINTGIAIIQPPSLDINANKNLEAQKISSKAGLYIVWDTWTDTIKAYDAPPGQYRRELYLDDLIADDPTENIEETSMLFKIKPDAFYDKRRLHKIKTLEINVGKLKQLIEYSADSSEKDETDYANRALMTITAKNNSKEADYGVAGGAGWNGVVYLEAKSSMPVDTPPTADQKEAISRLHYTGVKLQSGKVIPAPEDHTAPKTGIPSLPDIYEGHGFTFATNNAAYIQGHYNADGITDESSARYHEDGEVPTAVFADSVTILSKDWIDENNSGGNSYNSAGTTEVSTAIVSGIIPSNARNTRDVWNNPLETGNGRSSGGLHNFPRFLENWRGDLYIRGSFVCLYESEVDNSLWYLNTYKPAGISTPLYGPPGRKWGFNTLFANGTFPPGTPMIRNSKRLDFRFIDKEEYTEALADLPGE